MGAQPPKKNLQGGRAGNAAERGGWAQPPQGDTPLRRSTPRRNPTPPAEAAMPPAYARRIPRSTSTLIAADATRAGAPSRSCRFGSSTAGHDRADNAGITAPSSSAAFTSVSTALAMRRSALRSRPRLPARTHSRAKWTVLNPLHRAVHARSRASRASGTSNHRLPLPTPTFDGERIEHAFPFSQGRSVPRLPQLRRSGEDRNPGAVGGCTRLSCGRGRRSAAGEGVRRSRTA